MVNNPSAIQGSRPANPFKQKGRAGGNNLEGPAVMVSISAAAQDHSASRVIVIGQRIALFSSKYDKATASEKRKMQREAADDSRELEKFSGKVDKKLMAAATKNMAVFVAVVVKNLSGDKEEDKAAVFNAVEILSNAHKANKKGKLGLTKQIKSAAASLSSAAKALGVDVPLIVEISDSPEEPFAGERFGSAEFLSWFSWHNLAQVIADVFNIETGDKTDGISKAKKEELDEAKSHEKQRLEERVAEVKRQSQKIEGILQKIRSLLAAISFSSPEEAGKKIAQIKELSAQVAALVLETSESLKNLQIAFRDSAFSGDSAMALSIDSLRTDLSIAERVMENLGQKADLYARLYGQHSNRLS